MMQQINLYQPMFRKQKKVFSAMAMLQVVLIVLGLFSLVYASSYWQYRNLERQLATTSQQAEQIEKQLQDFKNRQAGVIKSKLLEREVGRLQREYEKGKKILNLISDGSLGNTQGFSVYLTSLARGHINGMWLTRINVEQGGSSLELDGVTLAAELVPKYLQKLAQEEVFGLTSFNVMDLSRSEKEPGQINFVVSTNKSETRNEIAQSTF